MGRLTKTDISMAINILSHPQSGDDSDIRKAVADAIEAMRELQRYKDLEEQGRLIELPCKVGDGVYDITEFIDKYDHPEIFEINVEWITITADKDGRLCFDISGYVYYQEDFGRIAFLTKEEAEAKLKELKEGVE